MTIREELLFDFSINMPRVLVTGETILLDNVKKIMVLSEDEIIVFHGNRYTSVTGHGFIVTMIKDERVQVSGEVEEIKFFKALQKDKD